MLMHGNTRIIMKPPLYYLICTILLLRLGISAFADEVQDQIDQLNNKDLRIRLSAVTKLGGLNDKRAIGPLMDRLRGDSNDAVRSQAAYALGALHDPQAVEILISILMDENNDVGLRVTAADALGKIGDPRAVEPLTKCLNSQYLNLASFAAQSLGAIRDPRAIEPLIECYRNHRNDGTGMIDFTADAVGLLRQSAVEPLLSCLTNDDANMRQFAVKAFYTMDEEDERPVTEFAITKIVKALPDWTARHEIREALQSLHWAPESEREQVYFWICNDDGNSLRTNWDQTTKILSDDLKSGDPQKIKNGVCSFICLGQADSISKLVDALNAQGTEELAEIFLGCDNQDLAQAARSWASAHQYQLHVSSSENNILWHKW
jgi:HEAT repeat protein